MQSYSFLEDMVIADMAFEASGDTPAELFQAAAQALFESMTDLSRLRPNIQKQIRLRHSQLDQLLFDWLAELIYIKDAEGILLSEFSVQLTQDNGWQLSALAQGERIDSARHDLRADVKAVTYHRFEVGQTEDGRWRARVVLDI
ncbi:MAG TPA: archease [Nitrospiria bacterium]